MPIDRKTFFDKVRGSLFGGHISQPQVEGIEAKLAEWDRRRLSDLRWLAYILATSYHETGRAMQPVREVGRGKGHAYGKPDPETGLAYYGRGDVQLTWKKNYQKIGNLIRVDLVNNPDAALDPDISAKALFAGMLLGTFTGKKLSDYFSATRDDPVNARRIVNGVDRAGTIAGYHAKFLKALHEASVAVAQAVVDEQEDVTTLPPAYDARNPVQRPFAEESRTAPKPAPIDDTEETPPSPIPALRPGYDPVVVMKVQRDLRRLRYWSAGEPDGVFANMTEDAILAFRKDNGLPLTPTIDDELLARLATADPRPISEKRANAQAPEVEGKLATVRTSWLAQVWAWILGIPAAITTFVSGAGDWFGDQGDSMLSTFSSLKGYFGAVPGWIWGIGVLVIVGAIIKNASQGKRAAVRAYQEGRLQ